ncbi:MAG TPA: SET domain-containing protein-lysine N-methyltransferase [Fibrobacteraceae bacterium]|nr:SET domain-containing protein-lysine N-methyltransferase [Fibrobacteraceae bacterium]
MMHPATVVRFVSEAIGIGVFARQSIPQGTLIWVRDPMDQILDLTEVQALPMLARDSAMTYMYRNCGGQYILLWDHAKYINHCCSPSCMPTPYGCDIALHDIAAGEELTEDYGLLNIIEDFRPDPTSIGAQGRRVVCGDDLNRFAGKWDAQLQQALKHAAHVTQPLWPLLDSDMANELQEVFSDLRPPRSVQEMSLS